MEAITRRREPVPLRDSEALLQRADRIEYLPLILAGPILRHTESDAVTVWVALKAPRQVTLNVYATDENGSSITALVLEGSGATVPLGQHLHIIAVTAKPIGETKRRQGDAGNPSTSLSASPHLPHSLTSSSLEPGQIYAYDLSFGSDEQTLAEALNSSIQPFPTTVSYFEHQLPTFAIPPLDLCDLRLAHGSCRKLHGGGQDALPILDDLIKHYAKEPNARLHQLFFTGDQIYGDDVADPLLWAATSVGDTLLGWEENLPLSQTSTTGCEFKKPRELKPGQRTDIAKDFCSFTAMLSNSPEKAKSHLFSMGEYFASYLLVWSPVLWSKCLPKGKDIYNDPKQAKQWDEQARHVEECISQLWKVRRALANVPTYMICDDHDITDDWYLNRAWCVNVLSKPLGRRVVQNGLLAYAVFQAWGNTPDQFQDGQPGGNLLQAATLWSASAGTDEAAATKISQFLGIPQIDSKTGLPKLKLDNDVLILDRDYPDGTRPLEWHYTIRSLKHEVIVLDTRTWRGYPLQEEEMEKLPDRYRGRVLDPKWMDESQLSPVMEGYAFSPPRLLCPTAFEQQIQKPLELTDRLKQTTESDIEVTFIVLPTNLVSLHIIDVVQQWELEKGNVFNSDVGDAWNLNEAALSTLLIELFKRRREVVVLSGDIHYAGTVRLSYWFGDHYNSVEQVSDGASPRVQNSNARVLAQLTASAFKNGELKTYFIHSKAKSIAPEQPQDWAGWNKPPELVEIQVTPGTVRMLDVELPTTGPVVRQVLGMRGNLDGAWEIVLKDRNSLPDWQYHVEWIKRQKATVAPWQEKRLSSVSCQSKNPPNWLTQLGNVASRLWRNQWVQEGEEVIGRNNFGVVSLQWSQTNEQAKAVIQDIYWRSSWKPSRVVCSRYIVPLYVDGRPPQLRALK